MHYVARSRWRGGMYGPASGIWSELTLHRGAAAAGEAETINNRATHLLCVSLLYLLYYYRNDLGEETRGIGGMCAASSSSSFCVCGLAFCVCVCVVERERESGGTRERERERVAD